MRRVSSVLLSCLTLFSSSALAAEATPLDVSLQVEPGKVYLERVPGGQALNFELVLHNRSALALDIDRLQVSVFDAGDHLLLRRFIDGNGVRPSVAVLGEHSVPAGATLALFNPFDEFPAELAIARLHYELSLSTADGARSQDLSLDLRPGNYRSASELRLPLRGPIINYDGHHRRFDTHFAPLQALGFRSNFMRYSFDFVPVDAKGEMFKGEFKDNAAWFGFGQDILAVSDGTVVAVIGDQPDNRSFDQGKLASTPMVLFGNYVVVDHGHGEFAVYAHAQQSSLRVKPGDRVRRGQVLAKIGASGSAFFPHLHFELQDGPDTQAEGLPAYFDGFSRILGAARSPRHAASVDTGEIVESD
jgi:murein DD-endopeptidase MepM/ murein hydrolase activator NlpD